MDGLQLEGVDLLVELLLQVFDLAGLLVNEALLLLVDTDVGESDLLGDLIRFPECDEEARCRCLRVHPEVDSRRIIGPHRVDATDAAVLADAEAFVQAFDGHGALLHEGVVKLRFQRMVAGPGTPDARDSAVGSLLAGEGGVKP